MSRSTNARSRYQAVPEHVRYSLSNKDSGVKRRSRDNRSCVRTFYKILNKPF